MMLKRVYSQVPFVALNSWNETELLPVRFQKGLSSSSTPISISIQISGFSLFQIRHCTLFIVRPPSGPSGTMPEDLVNQSRAEGLHLGEDVHAVGGAEDLPGAGLAAIEAIELLGHVGQSEPVLAVASDADAVGGLGAPVGPGVGDDGVPPRPVLR